MRLSISFEVWNEQYTVYGRNLGVLKRYEASQELYGSANVAIIHSWDSDTIVEMCYNTSTARVQQVLEVIPNMSQCTTWYDHSCIYKLVDSFVESRTSCLTSFTYIRQTTDLTTAKA